MARQGHGTPWQHTAEGTATNEMPHHGSEHAPRPSQSNRNPITMTTAEASSVLTECAATRYSVPPPEPRPGRVPGHVPVAEPFDLRRVQQRPRGTPVCQQRRPVGLRRHGDRNLFALRSTDPGVPLDHPDPVAPDSDHYLQAMLGRCDRRTRKPRRRPGRGRGGRHRKRAPPPGPTAEQDHQHLPRDAGSRGGWGGPKSFKKSAITRRQTVSNPSFLDSIRSEITLTLATVRPADFG